MHAQERLTSPSCPCPTPRLAKDAAAAATATAAFFSRAISSADMGLISGPAAVACPPPPPSRGASGASNSTGHSTCTVRRFRSSPPSVYEHLQGSHHRVRVKIMGLIIMRTD
jgi:hypothetical protein